MTCYQQAAYLQSQQLLREHNVGLNSLPPQTPILRSQTPVMMTAPTPLPAGGSVVGSAFNLQASNANVAGLPSVNPNVAVNGGSMSRMVSSTTLPNMAAAAQPQQYILPGELNFYRAAVIYKTTHRYL